MKILQVWEWAGIASIYSKYFRGLGHDCDVLKSMDKFGFLGFYEQPFWKGDVNTDALDLAEKYDVVHIHSRVTLPAQMRKRYPDKKIIHHYHGSEARGGGGNIDLVEQACDHVFVSTADLIHYVPKAEYLPNIVDRDHFKEQVLGSGMVAIANDGSAALRTRRITQNLKLDCMVLDRNEAVIPYKNMPTFLKKFDTYVDIKYHAGQIVYELSTTALQALSMGLNVLQANGNMIYDFPKKHDPKRIIDRLLEVYTK